ncbi:MAG: hypothetical protein KF803_12335 [Cyclobacteriaceae bacterium]|nr:hypothetical protein [Cyclobacteriaceae bacterium]
MRRLSDISIYYYGTEIPMPPEQWTFRYEFNFVADLYLTKLDGYKPPKTSAIRIQFNNRKVYSKPTFIGSICIYDTEFNDNGFITLNKEKRLLKILEILHNSIIEIGDFEKWDNRIFLNAYNEILKCNFQYEVPFKPILSRNKKISAQPKIIKTTERSILYVLIKSQNDTKEFKLIDKRNTYPLDPIKIIAKTCKWINTDTFGVIDGRNVATVDVITGQIINNLIFFEDVIKPDTEKPAANTGFV